MRRKDRLLWLAVPSKAPISTCKNSLEAGEGCPQVSLPDQAARQEGQLWQKQRFKPVRADCEAQLRMKKQTKQLHLICLTWGSFFMNSIWTITIDAVVLAAVQRGFRVLRFSRGFHVSAGKQIVINCPISF